ncbi:hypothetical protein J6590_104911, partial [Homalodisca vitripennis]
ALISELRVITHWSKRPRPRPRPVASDQINIDRHVPTCIERPRARPELLAAATRIFGRGRCGQTM